MIIWTPCPLPADCVRGGLTGLGGPLAVRVELDCTAPHERHDAMYTLGARRRAPLNHWRARHLHDRRYLQRPCTGPKMGRTMLNWLPRVREESHDREPGREGQTLPRTA
jgi:hypothetical protein